MKRYNNYLFVEVPENAVSPFIGNKVSNDKYLFYVLPNGIESVALMEGVFTIIGTTPLTEEQIKEIVGSELTFETMYCNMNPYSVPVSHLDRWNDLMRKFDFEDKKVVVIKINE